MITPGAISRASYCPVFVRPIVLTPSGPVKMKGATAFFYRRHDKSYLVTAWHVMSGRRPDEPSLLLPNYAQSPASLTFEFIFLDDFRVPLSSICTISLYEHGRPRWIEGDFDSVVDIAAIELDLRIFGTALHLPDLEVLSLPEAQRENVALEIGSEVIITGFPIERTRDNPFAIWKKGMIASEPSVKSFGISQVLIDTPGHPGMSGAPVYWNRTGINQRFSSAGPSPQTDLDFAGIYVGSTRNPILDNMNIGRIYLQKTINEVIDNPRLGNMVYIPASSF